MPRTDPPISKHHDRDQPQEWQSLSVNNKQIKKNNKNKKQQQQQTNLY